MKSRRKSASAEQTNNRTGKQEEQGNKQDDRSRFGASAIRGFLFLQSRQSANAHSDETMSLRRPCAFETQSAPEAMLQTRKCHSALTAMPRSRREWKRNSIYPHYSRVRGRRLAKPVLTRTNSPTATSAAGVVADRLMRSVKSRTGSSLSRVSWRNSQAESHLSPIFTPARRQLPGTRN